MTHPYFVAKATDAFKRAGGDPALAADLASWAEQAHSMGEEAPQGVVVAKDGSIVATTVRRTRRSMADYVSPEDAKRLGLRIPELGMAQGAIAQAIGQPVIYLTTSVLTRGAKEPS